MFTFSFKFQHINLRNNFFFHHINIFHLLEISKTKTYKNNNNYRRQILLYKDIKIYIYTHKYYFFLLHEKLESLKFI